MFHPHYHHWETLVSLLIFSGCVLVFFGVLAAFDLFIQRQNERAEFRAMRRFFTGKKD